eukprot:TRINITY_DN38680_c0_g1_i1.p1 TRINITY_DN38680_c0_g1~~TRINITY_DN38680_c0_g1_i1.p1  ORF type:complete len:219 (-),score=52.81 TRINITY_DN38680_c0_g1_i1:285-941(-)
MDARQYRSHVDDQARAALKALEDLLPRALDQGKPPAAEPSGSSDIIAALRDLQREQITAVSHLDDLCRYIEVRIPTIKDEDNAGVSVQHSVLNTIRSLTAGISGSGNGSSSSGKEGGSSGGSVGGVSLAANIGTLDDFLQESAKLDEKILPECRGKDAGEPPASVVTRQKALFTLTTHRIAAGWRALAAASANARRVFRDNREKIDTPRRDDYAAMAM